jgi:two-component system sensor histidine kinase UhpB
VTNKFTDHAVAMVALWAGGEPCGLLAVDWLSAHDFDSTELDALRDLGRYAAIAVGAARPFAAVQRQARLHSALARGSAHLVALTNPQDIVAALAELYTELLAPRSCAVAMLDSRLDHLGALAASVSDEPPLLQLADIPAELVERLNEAWFPKPRPVEIPADPWLARMFGRADDWYLFLPFIVGGIVRGSAVLGFGAHTRLTEEDQAAATALAAIGSAVLDRARMDMQISRQLSRLHTLYELSSALTDAHDAPRAVEVLRDALAAQGLELVGLSVTNRRLAQQLQPQEPFIAVADDRPTQSVPMRLQRRAVGSLTIRPARVDAETGEFVAALADSLAEVLHRNALRAATEEAARAQVLADERERLAHDLHDSSGQLFVAISLFGQRVMEQLAEQTELATQLHRIVALADAGKDGLNDAVRGLAFAPAVRRGLVPALRALIRSVTADSGIAVSLHVEGDPVRLPPEQEHVLYRVANESLANAWRHAQCTTIRIVLRFGQDAVGLTVRDNGCGLQPQQSNPAGLGTRALNRAVERVDGWLRVKNARPHGVVVDMHLPRV